MNKCVWLAPALMLLGACSQEPEDNARTFHDVMKADIDLSADRVWAVGNSAIGDNAGIDPAKMTDAKWTELAAGAEAVRRAALEIAAMDPVVLAKPGVKIADEDIPGGHSAAQVQARFDGDPQTLRDMADALAAHTGDLAEAARAHDYLRAGALVDRLDSVCESCHLEYWYPDQKALVEEILRGAP